MNNQYNAAAESIRFPSFGGVVQKPIEREKRPRIENYAVKRKKMVNISTGHIQTHAHWQASGSWVGVFDVAVWIRMPNGCKHPLQLALRYSDEEGEKSLAVDVFMPSAFSCALLNGSVNLQVSGRIHDVGLYLVGAEGDLLANIEEWHLTPQIKK